MRLNILPLSIAAFNSAGGVCRCMYVCTRNNVFSGIRMYFVRVRGIIAQLPLRWPNPIAQKVAQHVKNIAQNAKPKGTRGPTRKTHSLLGIAPRG